MEWENMKWMRKYEGNEKIWWNEKIWSEWENMMEWENINGMRKYEVNEKIWWEWEKWRIPGKYRIINNKKNNNNEDWICAV